MRRFARSCVQPLVDVVAEGSVVALTGAGISADSGVPTFRDPGGLWEVFDLSRHGTWSGLEEDAMLRPDALADLLSGIRATFARARPNRAHLALAKLETAGLLQGLITQNVDGLHQDAGSLEVIELHGSLRKLRCMRCGRVEPIGRTELVRTLNHMIAGLRSSFIPSLRALYPRCRLCGGPAPPDIVTFGDRVKGLDLARRHLESCRTLMVIGTSAQVSPAAELPDIARSAGARIVQIGLERTSLEPDILILGRANRILQRLAKGLRDGLAVSLARGSADRPL